MTLLLLPALASWYAAQAAVQPSCEGWTTERFWSTADPPTVRECLAAGYSIHDRIPPYNVTSLHLAARYTGSPEVIAVLVEAGADLEASSPPSFRTPLHQAARFNENPEVVRTLLEYGADVNAVNERGRTPLHLAALYHDSPAIVEVLADATQPNVQNRDGETPLHGAAKRRPNDLLKVGDPNPAIVEVLLERGADLSAEALDGGTPEDWAEDERVANLIRGEAQRRSAILEGFLHAAGTRLTLAAVALGLLGYLLETTGLVRRLSAGRLGRSR